MLQAAHEKNIMLVDTTALQSRLVRCGMDYKNSTFRALQFFRKTEANIHIIGFRPARLLSQKDQLCMPELGRQLGYC
jgi:hypothetical protein